MGRITHKRSEWMRCLKVGFGWSVSSLDAPRLAEPTKTGGIVAWRTVSAKNSANRY